jgi:uncharacterized protein (DUF3820 family)
MGDDVKRIQDANEYRITWGKFYKRKLKDIPNYYIRWLAEEKSSTDVGIQADIVLQWRKKYGVIIEG